VPPQRWRLTLRRDAASDVVQRDLQHAWDATLRDAGLLPWPPEWLAPAPPASPPAASLGPRLTQPKVVVAAPLPLRMTADRELVDLYLPQSILLHEARRRLEPALPPGHHLVDLHDVWFGAPALPGMVVAADYRVEVNVIPIDSASSTHPPSRAPAPGNADDIGGAIEAILAAANVPRGRVAEGRGAVNLRSLIIAIWSVDEHDWANEHVAARAQLPPGRQALAEPDVTTTELWMRLRLDSSVGSGRPDDIVDAIAARTGQPLTIVRQHRERLWLRDDPGCPAPAIPNPDSKTAPTPAAGPARNGRPSSPRGTHQPPRS